MKFSKVYLVGVILIVITMTGVSYAGTQGKFSVNTGLDFVSRYVWRGMDFGDAPSLQPSITFSYHGLEFGWWGAYALSNNASDFNEIDTWLNYSYTLDNSMRFTVGILDFYLPNAGIRMFNYHDVDDPEGPGAHLLEVGVGVDGPDAIPVSLFGYINIYNDEGNNTYFQLDYRTGLAGTDMDFFVGAVGGSEENPDYYGTDDFQVINVGMTASREIAITEQFSLPISVSYIVNPKEEISYMVFCLSL